MAETWIINETITSFLIPAQEIGFHVTDSEGEFRCHSIIAYSGTIPISIETAYISYLSDDFGNLMVYENGIWLEQGYRTVTFETAPTGDLLTWLEANGTLTAPPSEPQYRIKKSTLDNIADAINEKAGTSGTMTPAEMATAIEAIPSGGGEVYHVSFDTEWFSGASGVQLGYCDDTFAYHNIRIDNSSDVPLNITIPKNSMILFYGDGGSFPMLRSSDTVTILFDDILYDVETMIELAAAMPITDNAVIVFNG